jgi:ANTAR domain
MVDHLPSADPMPTIDEADLKAYFRHRDDVPRSHCVALIRSLSQLRGYDDPIVAFARLPEACVPEFADGCEVGLADGIEQQFRSRHPVDSARADHPVGPEQILSTPFRAVSRFGYPSYSGVVTHWWIARTPTPSDAAIADLAVKHVVALVDHERLTTVLARAENRAANLALEAISGRTIDLATGIVMHQNALAADDAERLLRRYAAMSGRDLHQVAASVTRSGQLPHFVADSSRLYLHPIESGPATPPER